MPAILDPGTYVRWLGERPITTNELRALLRPFLANSMECFKLGTKIGNPKYEHPNLVEPLTAWRIRLGAPPTAGPLSNHFRSVFL
jgi:putative SOS response-associated peptidase YedK